MSPSLFPQDNRESNEPVENGLSSSSVLPQDNRGSNGPVENALIGSSALPAQDDGGNDEPVENALSSSRALPQDNQQNDRPAQNGLDAIELRRMIEDCLESYMSKNETAETLFDRLGIDPSITNSVWDIMEETHPDFFKSYYLMLLLSDQVNCFNEWFEGEMAVMKKDIADLQESSEYTSSIASQILMELQTSIGGRPAAASTPDPQPSVAVFDPQSSVAVPDPQSSVTAITDAERSVRDSPDK